MDTFSAVKPALLCTLSVQREDSVALADGEVIYQLCVLELGADQLYARLCYRGEVAVAYLGEDAVFANTLYQRLVAGTVTPCTLCDVVRDAFFEQGRILP